MLDGAEARERLREILSQKEYTVYHEQSKGLIASWWEDVKEWAAELLEKLLPSEAAANAAAGPVLIIFIIGVLAVVAAAVYLLVRHTNRRRKFREQPPVRSKRELEWTPAMHLQEADKKEAAGDYTQAVRHLFLAFLLELHGKGLLEARVWKTNWEYAEELKRSEPSLTDRFRSLARLFDEVTYGKRNIRPDEYRSYRAEVIGRRAAGEE